MLLDKGAEVNAQGGRYGNALQAASEGGHEKVIQMLLDKSAEVNAQGGEYNCRVAIHVTPVDSRNFSVLPLLISVILSQPSTPAPSPCLPPAYAASALAALCLCASTLLRWHCNSDG